MLMSLFFLFLVGCYRWWHLYLSCSSDRFPSKWAVKRHIISRYEVKPSYAWHIADTLMYVSVTLLSAGGVSSLPYNVLYKVFKASSWVLSKLLFRRCCRRNLTWEKVVKVQNIKKYLLKKVKTKRSQKVSIVQPTSCSLVRVY